MTEVDRRADNVIASTLGDTINPFTLALLTSAAVATGHPELAPFTIPVAALAGSLGEHGYVLVKETVRDRASRVERWLDDVAATAGQPAEEFIEGAVRDDAQREFLGRIIEAAAGTHAAWKIKLLARAFVQGAKDGSQIDETLLLVSLVSQLETSHARLLSATHRSPKQGAYRTEEHVTSYDPGLKPAMPMLRRTLVSLDLIHLRTGLELTDLGEAVVRWFDALGVEVNAGEAASGS